MTAESVLAKFNEAAADPLSRIGEIKEATGRKVVGCFLYDVPEELLHAAGLQPLVFWGTNKPISKADTLIQSFCCSLVRSSVEVLVDGTLDQMEGMIIPHVCDSAQQMASTWKYNFDDKYTEDYFLPKKLRSQASRDYLLAELNRFKGSIEGFAGGEVTEDSLRESVKLYNRNRALLRELNDLRLSKPGVISDKDFYTAVKASMAMPKEEHSKLMRELLDALKDAPGGDEPEARVVLSGVVWEPPGILDLFAEVGVGIVGDDLYNGSRYFLKDVAESGDPMEALANRFIDNLPFCCYHYPQQETAQHLIKLVKDTDADGIVILEIMFCEPQDFEHPDLVKAIEEAGIPELTLETEQQTAALGQLRTRLEAFIEMIGG
jgi:benzoyl-CoA reductase subunit C